MSVELPPTELRTPVYQKEIRRRRKKKKKEHRRVQQATAQLYTHTYSHTSSKDLMGRLASMASLDPAIRKPAARLLLSQLIQTTGLGCLMPALPVFASSLGLGPTATGALLSSSAFARFLSNAPFGRASDLVGRKPMMLGGPVVLATGVAGTAFFAPELAYMAPCRLLTGAGRSIMRSGR